MFLNVSPSRNHYKFYIVVYIYYCNLVGVFLFTFIIVMLFEYFRLLVYHVFMLVFVVILNNMIICKQVCSLHCFVLMLSNVKSKHQYLDFPTHF